MDSRCLVLSSFLVGVAQPTGWQGTTSSTKRKENDPTATINNNRNPILFLFLCRRRSTRWMAGNNIVYNRTKRERSDGDNQQEQDPILISFLCRRRSTRWMAGNNIVYNRAKREQSDATINNRSDPTATINKNNPPLRGKSNNRTVCCCCRIGVNVFYTEIA